MKVIKDFGKVSVGERKGRRREREGIRWVREGSKRCFMSVHRSHLACLIWVVKKRQSSVGIDVGF